MLSASGAASAATIKGGTTVSLGSRPVTLTYDGSNPALTLSAGALQLNNNAFTVVVPGTALGAGTYTLVSTPGAIPAHPTPRPLSPAATASPAATPARFRQRRQCRLDGDERQPAVSGPVSAAPLDAGPGLASLTANGTNTQVITVQARDANNVNETNGGATVVFPVSGSGTIGSTTDNHNGTYSATLKAPASAGLGTVTATLNGTSVGTLVAASRMCGDLFLRQFRGPGPGLRRAIPPTSTTAAWRLTRCRPWPPGWGRFSTTPAAPTAIISRSQAVPARPRSRVSGNSPTACSTP